MKERIQKFYSRTFTKVRNKAIGYALLAFVVAVLGWGRIEKWIEEKMILEAKAQTTTELTSYGISLTQTINQRLDIVRGLAAFASVHQSPEGDVDQERYDLFAGTLYQNTGGIRNIALAPGGVMTFVYPYEENKAVIGYEPAVDERSFVRDEVQRAIETGEVVMSRPYELVQGGTGIIARQAIFIDGEYWGLANVVVGLSTLLADAGLVPAPSGMQIALKDQDGYFFWGDESIYTQNPVTTIVRLPEGTWELSGLPEDGWRATYEGQIIFLRWMMILGTISWTISVYLIANRQMRLDENVKEKTKDLTFTFHELQKSQERYQLLFNLLPYGGEVLDTEGTIIECSASNADIFGYEKDELLGMHVTELLDPVDKEVYQDLFPRIMQGETVRAEVRMVTKDGGLLNILRAARPVLDDGGNVVSILVTNADITQRVQAEQALHDSHTRMLTLLNSIPADIYVSDLDTHEIIFANDYLRKKFGDDLVGKICHEVFRNESQPCSICPNKQLLDSDGNPFGLIVWEGQNPISERWYINYDRAVPWTDGRLVHVQIAADITERVQAEEELRRRANELAAMHQIIIEITTKNELSDVLTSIVARSTELLGASSGGMYLCDPEKREVRCVVSYQTPQDYTGTVLKYGDGAAGHVAESGEMLIIDDYRAWSGRAPSFDDKTPFSSIISVPMLWQEQVLGVIHILHEQDFEVYKRMTMDMLPLFAKHAAIAVANAELYADVQRHADELERRVEARTEDLNKIVMAMTGREVRMAELKNVIKKLRAQLIEARLVPVADDPLLENRDEHE